MGLSTLAKRVDHALFENARAARHHKKMQAALRKPFDPTLPKVNLLPEQVQNKMVADQAARKFVLGAAAIIVGVGGVYMFQDHQTDAAANELAAVQQRTVQLQAQERALAPFGNYVAAVQEQSSMVQGTMAREVLTSQVTTRLYLSAPTGVRIDSFTLQAGGVAVEDTENSACQTIDPFNTAGVASAGCLLVSGEADSRADLSKWLDNLNKDQTFIGPFVPSTTFDINRGVFNFTAEVGLNSEQVYKNRYADPAFLQGVSR